MAPAVSHEHVEALRAVLDLLNSFPIQIRRWVLLQMTSNGLHSSPSKRLQKSTSNAPSTGLQIGLQNADEREGLVLAFSSFWTAFPRKQGKQEALRNYLKLKPDQELQELILKALQEQSTWEQWTKDEGRFIPLPSTWLHQRRWEDFKSTSSGPSEAMFGRTPASTFKRFMERHQHEQ